jgi:hypothetical protein
MADDLDAFDGAFHRRQVAQVAGEPFHVANGAFSNVKSPDGVSAFEQFTGDVAPDKSRRTGEQEFHRFVVPF